MSYIPPNSDFGNGSPTPRRPWQNPQAVLDKTIGILEDILNRATALPALQDCEPAQIAQSVYQHVTGHYLEILNSNDAEERADTCYATATFLNIQMQECERMTLQQLEADLDDLRSL